MTNEASGRDERAAHHDLGGHPTFSCVPVLAPGQEPDDLPPDAFGKRVDALRQILAAKGLLKVDELRRGIEAIPKEEYHALTYYERWLRSMTGLMIEKGVVSPSDLGGSLSADEWVRR